MDRSAGRDLLSRKNPKTTGFFWASYFVSCKMQNGRPVWFFCWVLFVRFAAGGGVHAVSGKVTFRIRCIREAAPGSALLLLLSDRVDYAWGMKGGRGLDLGRLTDSLLYSSTSRQYRPVLRNYPRLSRIRVSDLFIYTLQRPLHTV